MATTVAKAKRREAAMSALRAECARLAALFDVPGPAFTDLAKDPDIARAQVIEEVAAFMARIGAAVAELLRTAAAARAGIADAQPEPEPEPEPQGKGKTARPQTGKASRRE